MVGAEEVIVDVGGLEMVDEGGRNEKIVDAPTDVALAGLCPMRPPGVTLEGRVEVAESVDETSAEEIFNSLTFFVGEAGVVSVVIGASKVEWGVRDIEIAADNNWFGEFESFEMAEKCWVPDLLAEL